MKLAKNIMCIKLRSGIEIWVEKEKAEKLINLLGTTQTKFVEIENEIINSADVEGIFTPTTMEEMTRRKNGQWKCDYNTWHNRGEICSCCELEKFKRN
jgi:hypothetical protein